MTADTTSAPPAAHRGAGRVHRLAALGLAAALVLLAVLALAARAHAATGTSAAATTAPPPPAQDPFYTYTGTTPLSQIAPGTVLKTRTVNWHVAGIAFPVTVVQLLYRSTTVQQQPTTNVTSVLLPPHPSATPRLVAYNSFYDSLNPDDDPSYTFAGAPLSIGTLLTSAETLDISGLLAQGDTVDVADTEGSLSPEFAVGPAYARYTLDAMRAAVNSPATGVTSTTPMALMGYSGGSIATGWAAQMAPSYAPDIERRLVGATMGGVFVDPDHNLHYVEGSTYWSGVLPLALVGIARAYHVSLTPYLSAYGEKVTSQVSDASIEQVTGFYPGLTWQQLTQQPQYPQPETVPVLVRLSNLLTMGRSALPQVPMQIYQGDQGVLEGTQPGGPGIGPGDGVMIAGDVRTYAREVCAAGAPVSYTQVPLGHEGNEPVWSLAALGWLKARFAGAAAPSNCASIAPGNSLAPAVVQPQG